MLISIKFTIPKPCSPGTEDMFAKLNANPPPPWGWIQANLTFAVFGRGGCERKAGKAGKHEEPEKQEKLEKHEEQEL